MDEPSPSTRPATGLLGRREFLRDLALATASVGTAPTLLAACGNTTAVTAGSQDTSSASTGTGTGTGTGTTTTGHVTGEWELDGAGELSEVIVATSAAARDTGGGPVRVYDAGFGALREGTLRPAAYLPTDLYEHAAPTLSFPYVVDDDGENSRRVLRRIDFESGTDQIVFSGAPDRGIHRVVANPASGEYVFAYSNDSSDYGPLQLWRASAEGHERIPYEDSFGEIVHAEDDLPGGGLWSPFGGVFPLAIDPAGTRLLFARRLLYSLDLASGRAERFESSDAATSSAYHPAFSPDGTRLVVSFYRYTSDRRVLVVIDLASGNETEIRLPAPLEGFAATWHPDGRRLACKGYMDLEGPGSVAGMSYSSVFLVDTVTGESQEVPRNPTAPGAPPAVSEFEVDDVWNHNLVGFSRDGLTLFVLESHYQAIPPSQTTTTSVPPTTWGQPGLDPPPPFPYRPVSDLVAVDVEQNTRIRTLPDVGSVILAHP